VNKATSLQPIHQFDSAVMLDLQPLGQFRNLGTNLRWQTLDGEKKLVLTWFQSRVARCSFAKPQKPANLVPEFGQRLIVPLR